MLLILNHTELVIQHGINHSCIVLKTFNLGMIVC